MPTQVSGQLTVPGAGGALLSAPFGKPDQQALVEVTSPVTVSPETVYVEGTQDGATWFGVACIDTNTLTIWQGGFGTGGVTLNPVLVSQAFKIDVTNLTQLRVWMPLIPILPVTILIRTDAFFNGPPVVVSIPAGGTVPFQANPAEQLAAEYALEEPLGMNKFPITLNLTARPDPNLIGVLPN